MELYLNKLFFIFWKKHLKIKLNDQNILGLNHKINHKKYHYSKENLDISKIKENNNIDLFNKIKILYSGIILNRLNISSIKHSSITPSLKENMNNIQYLSLRSNHIRSLHFIKHLPNLYYLDISENPLDDIEILNSKKIFGYLKLSLEKYSEKKILNINGLYCGIIELDLEDKSLLSLFKNNNPFIGLFNNKVNYFYDKVISDEEKNSRLTRRYSFKALQTEIQRNITSENTKTLKDHIIKEENNIKYKNNEKEKREDNAENKEKDNIPIRTRKKRISSIKLKYTFINCYNYGFKSKKSMKLIEKNNNNGIESEIRNKRLLKIKNFFDNYNDIIVNICNNCNAHGRKTKLPVKSKYLKNYREYLSLEKDKLILLSNIYQTLSIFNKEKKENKYIILSKDNINVNPNIDNIEMFQLKKYIKCIYTSPNIAIIILIALLFYCLGIISNLLMNTLIGHLLVKYYKYIEVFNYPKFENENSNFHFLCYYLDNYENVKNKFNYLNIKDKKILDIMNLLEMTKITLKSNELYENKRNFNNMNINDINKYIDEIEYLESLEIKEEILALLAYLCDFIIYENLEQLLINNGYPNEYSYLIRFKEIIKEKEFKIKENEMALSERKYQKHQLDRLYNKFYFKLYKVEEIKNSKFTNKRTKFKHKINNIKEIEREEYVNTEKIDNINDYLIIKNKTMNNKIFQNVDSFKIFSKTINNYDDSNLNNNSINFQIKNTKKDNASNISINKFSFDNKYIQNNIKYRVNNQINLNKIIECDISKLLLKTLNNFNKKKRINEGTKLLLKNKNYSKTNKFINYSDKCLFKTFSNEFSIKSLIKDKENKFNLRCYKCRNNYCDDIDELYDLINEKNKKFKIRNFGKINSLRNAERIYSKKNKDFLFLTLTEKNNIKSRNRNINDNKIPSLDIKKYNQKEMAKILLNYKIKKNKRYIKKESKYT